MMKNLFLILTLSIVIPIFLPADTNIPAGPVNGTWDLAGSPYFIEGEINIPAGETLNIEPGVLVEFQGHYKFLIYGYLEAIGDSINYITFTATDTLSGWHSLRFINAPDNSHLSFCHIEYGKATGAGEDAYGGAVFCDNSNPIFNYCTFTNNVADYGGAVQCLFSSPSFSYCTISENFAVHSGGAMDCYQECNLNIENCIISNNVANTYTGGIQFYENCNPTVANCQIIGNSALTESCGGIRFSWSCNGLLDSCDINDNYAFDQSGGIRISHNSSPTISNCNINGNSAGAEGGGIYSYDNCNPQIINCDFHSNTAGATGGGINFYDNCNPEIINSYIRFNDATLYGGGIHCENNSTMNLMGCIIYSNSSIDGGGLEIWSSTISIINCTIDHNDAPNNGSQIDIWTGGSVNMINSIISGNSDNESIYFSNPSSSLQYSDFFNDGLGENFSGNVPAELGIIDTVNFYGDDCDNFFNIFEDPLFHYTGWNPHGLQDLSPCIDAGIQDTLGLNLQLFDIIGNTRIVDGRGDGFAFIDIGACELPEPIGGDDNTIIKLKDHILQNYPNPFNPTTTINYTLKEDSKVSLNIYNIKGQKVKELVSEQLSAGKHSVVWDGTDDNSKSVSSGIYFYKMITDNYEKTKRMILIK